MPAYKILMAYDFTIADETTLNFVINAFSYRKDATVTLFNAYIPLPEIDVKASPELAKMNRGMAFLANEIKEKEQGLKDAKDFLVRYGFGEDRVDFILKKRAKSISKEIIDLVVKNEYKVIVLSRQAAKVSRFYARSVHNQLLTVLKDVTVCITA